jgi:hypothetical protein
VRVAREGVAGVAAAEVRFELVEAVCLDEFDARVVFVGVAEDAVVDMPDEEARAGQERVRGRLLAVFDEEVLGACRGAVGPEAVRFEVCFHVAERDGVVFGFGDCSDPVLAGFAPWRELVGAGVDTSAVSIYCTYRLMGELVGRRRHPMSRSS